jgi:hypothetical protein
MDQKTEAFQARTDAKLRYARVHLDELTALTAHSGDDFDRAHQESFLFHLFGTRDAFLIELNHYYNLELSIECITQGKLREALRLKGIQTPELSELFALEQDDASWYRQTKDMRDYSIHSQGVARSYFMGGDDIISILQIFPPRPIHIFPHKKITYKIIRAANKKLLIH